MIVPLRNPIFTVTEPQITKDRFSPWSKTIDDEVRESGSTLIARMLTRNGVCEQAEHVSRHMYKWNTANTTEI